MSVRYRTCVIFGGTGFIGINFAKYLREQQLAERIILADLRPPESSAWPEQASELCRQYGNDGNDNSPGHGSDHRPHVSYVPVDVRQPIDHPDLPSRDDQVDLVANFAAIHREPGHRPEEYFQTNLPGAEQVCSWAEQVGCPRIIFTSSIAPYGPTEEERDENTIPVPVSPYGASKLAAEKIHLAWQRAADDRKLLIVRPGVVFGPGEGGKSDPPDQSGVRSLFLLHGKSTHPQGGRVCQGTLRGAGLEPGQTGNAGRAVHPVQFYDAPRSDGRRVCPGHLPGGQGSPDDSQHSLPRLAWRRLSD